jgi:hypothetical protein
VPGDSLPDPNVEVVQSDGADADPDLARAGLGDRTLFENERLGSPVLADDDGAHRQRFRSIQTLFVSR